MKHLKKYWEVDPIETNNNGIQRKLEIVEIQGQKAVMDAKSAYINAVQDRDDYLANSSNVTNGTFSNIVEHQLLVNKKLYQYEALVDVFEQLFPTE